MTRGWGRRMHDQRRAWMERPFPRLVAHFLQRMFTSGLESDDSSSRLGLGSILGLLAIPGLLVPLMILPKYSSLLRFLRGQLHFDIYEASVPEKYMLIAFTMSVTGLVAVLKWESLFPDGKDLANLGTLPISPRDIFLAKLLALTLFLALFVVAVNAASTVTFPLIVLGATGSFSPALAFIGSHAVSVVAASVFSFLAFVALAGLLIAVLPYRLFRTVSLYVQFSSVVALMVMLLASPATASLIENRREGSESVLWWLPSVWFLGFYQKIHGLADATLERLGAMAIAALVIVIPLAAISYAFSYRRYLMQSSELPARPVATPRWIRSAARWTVEKLFFRSRFESACFLFIWKTLLRNRAQQLVCGGYLGAGLAVTLQWLTVAGGSARAEDPVILSVPLVISFCTLSGLRFAFSVPADLRANWVFQLAPNRTAEEVRRLARKTMWVLWLPAMILICVPVYARLWDITLGLLHTGFVLLLSLVLTDALLLGFRKIPFTCSYLPGKNNVTLTLAL